MANGVVLLVVIVFTMISMHYIYITLLFTVHTFIGTVVYIYVSVSTVSSIAAAAFGLAATLYCVIMSVYMVGYWYPAAVKMPPPNNGGGEMDIGFLGFFCIEKLFKRRVNKNRTESVTQS